jgi:hypothetical protein
MSVGTSLRSTDDRRLENRAPTHLGPPADAPLDPIAYPGQPGHLSECQMANNHLQGSWKHQLKPARRRSQCYPESNDRWVPSQRSCCSPLLQLEALSARAAVSAAAAALRARKATGGAHHPTDCCQQKPALKVTAVQDTNLANRHQKRS